jgi:hypothetical protein
MVVYHRTDRRGQSLERQADMGTLHFLRQLAELLLVSDESTKDWLSHGPLLRVWYGFCGVFLGLCLLAFSRLPLQPLLAASAHATLAYRLFVLAGVVLFEALLFLLAFNYYTMAVSQKVAIRLDNVFWFYFLSVVIFGSIYVCVYHICPGCYIYPSPPLIHSSTSSSFDFWRNLRINCEFVLFSAFESVNGSFYRIQAQSIFVSILIYIESLFTLGLVALFIASYVNHQTSRPTPPLDKPRKAAA